MSDCTDEKMEKIKEKLSALLFELITDIPEHAMRIPAALRFERAHGHFEPRQGRLCGAFSRRRRRAYDHRRHHS